MDARELEEGITFGRTYRNVGKSGELYYRWAMQMAPRRKTGELIGEYLDSGEYMDRYMKARDIRYDTDMYRSVEEMMRIQYEQDRNVDKRLAIFGESDKDAHASRCKMQLVNRYDAMMFENLATSRKKGRQKISRRNDFRLIAFLDFRGETYIGVSKHQIGRRIRFTSQTIRDGDAI